MPKRSTSLGEPRAKQLTKEEKKALKKEYDRVYYEKYKEEWNSKEKKKCECGYEVINLSSHRKTRLHRDIMKMINDAKVRESLYTPANFISSAPRSGLAIGLGLGLASR